MQDLTPALFNRHFREINPVSLPATAQHVQSEDGLCQSGASVRTKPSGDRKPSDLTRAACRSTNASGDRRSWKDRTASVIASTRRASTETQSVRESISSARN